MQKTIFKGTTEVPAERSAGEITGFLVQAGARSIHTNYENGKVVGLSFVLPFGNGKIPYSLPVRIDPVFKWIQKQRTYNRQAHAVKDREQAERVAWRQLLAWIQAQFALIQTGMVESAEVFMPYMVAANGETFFDTYKPRMLAAATPAAEEKQKGA